MDVVVKSEVTIKHLRNLLVLCKEAKFNDIDGIKVILFSEAFNYLLEVSNKIEEELKSQADD